MSARPGRRQTWQTQTGSYLAFGSPVQHLLSAHQVGMPAGQTCFALDSGSLPKDRACDVASNRLLWSRALTYVRESVPQVVQEGPDQELLLLQHARLYLRPENKDNMGLGGVKRSLLHDTLSLIRVAKGNVLPPVYCPVYTPISPCQPGGFVKGRSRDKAHGTKLLSTRLGMTSGHSSPAINR